MIRDYYYYDTLYNFIFPCYNCIINSTCDVSSFCDEFTIYCDNFKLIHLQYISFRIFLDALKRMNIRKIISLDYSITAGHKFGVVVEKGDLSRYIISGKIEVSKEYTQIIDYIISHSKPI